jgi:NADH-quinone oxidoreductase subunit M
MVDLIWMSLAIFLPSLFAVVLIFFPSRWKEAMRWWSLLGTAVTLGVCSAVVIMAKYETIDSNKPLDEASSRARISLLGRSFDLATLSVADAAPSNDWLGSFPWIGRFNINYYLGVDGISLPLILLTAVLFFVSMIASWRIERFVKGYCILFLVLETGVLGVFFALDFFLFFVFWEVMLLPMYFLIGIWGGPRREYAAIKFFLYTMLGSVFILIAMLAFYFTNARDFVAPARVDEEVGRETRERYGPNARDAQREAVRKDIVVNTFDMLALQRMGQAAQAYHNGQEVTPVAVTIAEQQLAQAREEHALAKGEEKAKAQQVVEEKEAALARAKHEAEGARARMESQWFFQPWFQYTMFLFLLVGFAIKVPVFPFHTWLPDAHVEAPTPISMILAGILLKLGGYGIIRVAYPICPWAAQQLATVVATFGVINIVYGAFTAMAQTDFKKLVAYSSISHMGYVLLGIAVWASGTSKQYWAWGMNGAMFQMIAHGITSAGMFFLVGVIYDRVHHRNLDNFRGLYEYMPLYGGISAVIFFAAMGLPGMCGFVGEFMVVLSTWNFAPEGQRWIGITFAVLAALTVVLTAGYILWTLQRVFMGSNDAMEREYRKHPDMTWREVACAAPLVVLSIALGVLPAYLLLDWMEPSVTGLIDTLARLQ